MAEGLNKLVSTAEKSAERALDKSSEKVFESQQSTDVTALTKQLAKLQSPKVEVINQPMPGLDKVLLVIANTLEHAIMPLVRNMDKKLDIDLRNHEKIVEVSTQIKTLQQELAGKKPKSPPSP
jgi:hypothetical protein